MLTVTFRYFHVKTMTAGRNAITTHPKISIADLISQFKDKTQGESSSQDSHPSAQGRHTK